MKLQKNIVFEKNVTLIEIFIPIFYILNQYSISNISVGLICMVCVIFISVLRYKTLNVYNPLLVLFVFMFVHDMLKIAFVDVNIGLWVERFVYIFFLMCIPRRVNKENLYKVWSIVGTVAMLGLYYQAFQVYFFGKLVTTINLLPFLNSQGTNYLLAYNRPHSLFLEPAAYCTWMLPLLCMNLQKNRKVFSILISISIFLSTSSTGIIMVGAAWMYYAYLRAQNEKKKLNALMIVSFFVIGIGVLANTDIFSAAFDKLANISLSNTSNFVRLALGFQLFIVLPFVEKFLGIPFMNVEAYLRSGKVDLGLYGLSYETTYLGFVNALGDCLLMYGIIGALIYIRMFVKMWLEAEGYSKCYVALAFLSIFGQSVFWNSLFVTQIAFILSNNEKIECKKIRLF